MYNNMLISFTSIMLRQFEARDVYGNAVECQSLFSWLAAKAARRTLPSFSRHLISSKFVPCGVALLPTALCFPSPAGGHTSSQGRPEKLDNTQNCRQRV